MIAQVMGNLFVSCVQAFACVRVFFSSSTSFCGHIIFVVTVQQLLLFFCKTKKKRARDTPPLQTTRLCCGQSWARFAEEQKKKTEGLPLTPRPSIGDRCPEVLKRGKHQI